MSRARRAAGLLACGWLFTLTASAGTHVAAVSKDSLPPVSKDARKLPIDVSSSHVDYKGDTVVFHDIVITQGDTKVMADHAHATDIDDFQNSRWTFEGNVRINGEQHGSLRSDEAVVEFRNNHISKATITGSPAEFEQKRSDTDQTARGRAHQMVYDLSNGTVRLSNDAWVSDGRNEISGPELVYSIREQRIQASTQQGSDQRVHIRIPSPASDDSGKKP